MPRSAHSARFGRRRAQHRRGRGDPARRLVVIPVIALIAIAVGVGGYALSGGFKHDAATTTTTTIVSSTLPPASTAPSTTTASATTSPATTSSTTTSSTTTTSTTTTTTIPPLPISEVLVEVLNGTGVKGEAARVASSLTAAGFDVNGTGDAATYGNVASVIQYAPGHLAAAETVAAHVEGAVSLQVNSQLANDKVNLVIGSDLTAISN